MKMQSLLMFIAYAQKQGISMKKDIKEKTAGIQVDIILI